VSGASFHPRLYAPGPVAVPPEVLAALSRPVVHHRTEAFRATFRRVRSDLAELMAVPGDDVVVLTGSGTTAFEAALLAAVPAGGRVLALRGGKFGDRWAGMARAFGFAVEDVDLPWGRAFDPVATAAQVAAHPPPAAITLVHSETSTGVLHDVEALARALRQVAPEALLLVDAVTSLAAAVLRPRLGHRRRRRRVAEGGHAAARVGLRLALGAGLGAGGRARRRGSPPTRSTFIASACASATGTAP
jgi:aspartate aminotransferase-like enzyme